MEQAAAHDMPEFLTRVTSEDDRRRVRDHLRVVLADPLFSNSKRLPAFLRYVVNEALEGVSEVQMKERTLGVAVFGRVPDYDTNADPVVRVTAGEVRKKLAQFYYANHATDVQIEVPLGSYLPRFRLAHQPSAPEASIAPVPIIEPASLPQEPIALSSRKAAKRFGAWAAIASLLLLVCVGALAWKTLQHRAVDTFWGGFSSQSGEVLIVLPALARAPEALPLYHFEAESVAIEDAEVASRVSNEFYARKLSSHLVLASTASLNDLRSGPFVLIGAMDNVWTMRLSQSLPLAFERSEDRRYGRIVDRKNASLAWTEDFSVPNAQIPVDYGIVARFSDPATDQPTLLIAGISAEGTLAAGEAVTNPRNLAELLKAVGNPQSSFEAVIQTRVIGGQSGPPEIVAMRTW